MRGWIYALANVLPWPVSKGAKWLADRIWGVFSDGVRFALWIKDGFYTLARDGRTFLTSARTWIAEAHSTIKWLVITRIPKIAADTLNNAIKWATSRVNWALNIARGLVSTLERWTRATINTLRSWAESSVKWLTGQVNSLLANVKKVLDRVFGLWSTPLRLAEWLIGALWTVALRYLYSQRERIAAWFINSSGAFTVWLARTLENILVRML